MEQKQQRKPQVTSMAAAMMKAVADSAKHGNNPGRVGAHIIRASARGVGMKGNGHRVFKIAA